MPIATEILIAVKPAACPGKTRFVRFDVAEWPQRGLRLRKTEWFSASVLNYLSRRLDFFAYFFWR